MEVENGPINLFSSVEWKSKRKSMKERELEIYGKSPKKDEEWKEKRVKDVVHWRSNTRMRRVPSSIRCCQMRKRFFQKSQRLYHDSRRAGCVSCPGRRTSSSVSIFEKLKKDDDDDAEVTLSAAAVEARFVMKEMENCLEQFCELRRAHKRRGGK